MGSLSPFGTTQAKGKIVETQISLIKLNKSKIIFLLIQVE